MGKTTPPVITAEIWYGWCYWIFIYSLSILGALWLQFFFLLSPSLFSFRTLATPSRQFSSESSVLPWHLTAPMACLLFLPWMDLLSSQNNLFQGSFLLTTQSKICQIFLSTFPVYWLILYSFGIHKEIHCSILHINLVQNIRHFHYFHLIAQSKNHLTFLACSLTLFASLHSHCFCPHSCSQVLMCGLMEFLPISYCVARYCSLIQFNSQRTSMDPL